MDENAKHTPGPWKAVPTHFGPIDIFDEKGRDVVTVYGGGVEAGSKEANARLIASAPTLAAENAALKALVAELEADNAQLRAHIGDIHNRVRHELAAEIEAAADKAFKAMNGIPAIRRALITRAKEAAS